MVYNIKSKHSSHAAHSAHASHIWHSSFRFVLNFIHNHAFGSSHVWTDWGSIFKSYSYNFCGINNSSSNQINKLSFICIKAIIGIGACQNSLNSYDSFETSVVWNGSAGNWDSFLDDFDAQILLRILSFQGFKSLAGIKKSTSSSNNDTFFNSCLSSADGILDSIFNLSNLNFRSASNFNDTNTSW